MFADRIKNWKDEMKYGAAAAVLIDLFLSILFDAI